MRKTAPPSAEPVEPKRLRRYGEPGGNAEAAFDPEQRRWYHLDGLGERVYHGCPEGYEFDEAGKIHRLPDPVAD